MPKMKLDDAPVEKNEIEIKMGDRTQINQSNKITELEELVATLRSANRRAIDDLKVDKTTIAGLEAKLREQSQETPKTQLVFDIDENALLKFAKSLNPDDYPNCRSVLLQYQKHTAKTRITDVLNLIQLYWKWLEAHPV